MEDFTKSISKLSERMVAAAPPPPPPSPSHPSSTIGRPDKIPEGWVAPVGVTPALVPDPKDFVSVPESERVYDASVPHIPDSINYSGPGMESSAADKTGLVGETSEKDRAKATAKQQEMDRRTKVALEYQTGKRGDTKRPPRFTREYKVEGIRAKVGDRTISPTLYPFVVVVQTNKQRGEPQTQHPFEQIIGFAKRFKRAKEIRQAYLKHEETVGTPNIYATERFVLHAISDERAKNPDITKTKILRIRNRYRNFLMAQHQQFMKETKNHEIENTLQWSHAYTMVGDHWKSEREEIAAKEAAKADETERSRGALPTGALAPVVVAGEGEGEGDGGESDVGGVLESKSSEVGEGCEDVTPPDGPLDPDDDAVGEALERKFYGGDAPPDIVEDYVYPKKLRVPGQDVAVVAMLKDTDGVDPSITDDPDAIGCEPVSMFLCCFSMDPDGDMAAQEAALAAWGEAAQKAWDDVEVFSVNMYTPGRVDEVNISQLRSEKLQDPELNRLAQGLKKKGDEEIDAEEVAAFFDSEPSGIFFEQPQSMSAI